MQAPKGAPPSPPMVLFGMATGFMLSKALQVAAELGIADHLGDGERSAAELAASTGTHERALHRLMRALAANGVFAETTPGRFQNTTLSTYLRADVPGSVRDYVSYVPHDVNLKAWMRFGEVVKTEKPSFPAANGCTPFELLQKDPGFAQLFSRAMAGVSAPVIPGVLAAYDFSSCGRILDVGGGYGHVLAAVLKKHPALRGAVFDLGALADKARELLGVAGVVDRCEFVPGDFFHEVPSGYDTYMMKHILHDWSDAESKRILERCRAAMPAGKRLLLLEAALADGNDFHPAKWLDLQMMTALGGLERTEREWRALLGSAGFEITKILPTGMLVDVIEACSI